MTILAIQPDPSLIAEQGDFRARVSVKDGALLLPDELARFALQHGVRNAEDFMSFADSFPTALATFLGWTHQEVRAAAALLRKVVSQGSAMHGRAAHGEEPFRRGMGVTRGPAPRSRGAHVEGPPDPREPGAERSPPKRRTKR